MLRLFQLTAWLICLSAITYARREIKQSIATPRQQQPPKHSRGHFRKQLEGNGQQSNQRSDDICHIDKLIFPVRSVVINSSPPYKMIIHGPNSDKFISDSLYNGKGNQYFEKDLQSEMNRLVPEGYPPEKVIILDIGANIGLHALFFASKGYEVHAFEPLSTNYHLLQCSKAANNFHNLHINNFGLSNRTYTSCMGVTSNNQGHAFVKPENECDKEDAIQLRTLDDYIDFYLKDKEIFLAKIDVEGHEITAWLGGQRLLSQRPPKYVFSEVSTADIHPLGQTAQQYFELMEKYGYSAYHLRKYYDIKAEQFPPELDLPNKLYDVKFTHRSALSL